MNLFRKRKLTQDDLDSVQLEEFYCPCGRFLGFIAVVEGTVAIKCRRCKGFAIVDSRVDRPEALSDNCLKVETG